MNYSLLSGFKFSIGFQIVLVQLKLLLCVILSLSRFTILDSFSYYFNLETVFVRH